MRTTIWLLALVAPIALAQNNTIDIQATRAAAAQAQAGVAAAGKPGDELLTCEQLQTEFAAITTEFAEQRAAAPEGEAPTGQPQASAVIPAAAAPAAPEAQAAEEEGGRRQRGGFMKRIGQGLGAAGAAAGAGGLGGGRGAAAGAAAQGAAMSGALGGRAAGAAAAAGALGAGAAGDLQRAPLPQEARVAQLGGMSPQTMRAAHIGELARAKECSWMYQ